MSGVGEGDTWIIVESLKNQYPTRLRVSLEINYLKTSPCIASQIQSTNGVLTISQISGSAPFSCPIPWEGGFRGRSHLSPPYLESGSLKDVLMERSIICRVVKVHLIGSLLMLALCILSNAMLWTNRL